jgi:SAM-dependent methyltransferase
MSETSKCRNRVIKYLQGNTIDLGPDDDPISPWAIGIDYKRVTDHIHLTGDIRNLYWFKDGVMDSVFSSHCIEDLEDTEQALREWLRVIKRGGYLIIYAPHRDYYPNIGHPLANKGHRHDFIPSDIVSIVNKIGGTKLISNNTYSPPDGVYNYENRGKIEYSFELVFQKI